MAIAGGALVIIQGWLADRFGLQRSFLLTAGCELYILAYGLWGWRPVTSGGEMLADERLDV
jgi:FHS family L-fucose permease-like MFS transporter